MSTRNHTGIPHLIIGCACDGYYILIWQACIGATQDSTRFATNTTCHLGFAVKVLASDWASLHSVGCHKDALCKCKQDEQITRVVLTSFKDIPVLSHAACINDVPCHCSHSVGSQQHRLMRHSRITMLFCCHRALLLLPLRHGQCHLNALLRHVPHKRLHILEQGEFAT